MNYFLSQNSGAERGVYLYYAVIITSLLLAIAFGLGTILISQIKSLKEMGDSAIAFFAADTGIEKLLYIDMVCQKENCTSTATFGSLCQAQMDLVPTTTCIGLYDYSTSSSPTDFTLPDLSYEAIATTTGGKTFFKSKGLYKANQRAIETSR